MLGIAVKFTTEDLIGPGLTRIVRQNQEMVQKLERPHKLNVDTSQASSGLSSIKGLIGGVVGGLGLLGAVSWLKGTVDDFNSADQATAQFDASLKSTNNAVGLTRQSLLDMSTALMGKSLFDDDAITGAQSILLTFHNIRGTIYKETVPAMLDMATKMHLSLDSAAQLVGKALDSPLEGLHALMREGVRFSKSQQAMITKFAQTGQAAKAQSLMLQELKTEFGGSAEAASKAGTGGLTVLMNKFGNLRESIGGLLVGGMSKGYPFLDNLITKGQEAVDWFGGNFGKIKEMLRPLQEAVQPLIDTFERLWVQANGDGVGEGLSRIFNRIGTAIQLVSPFIKVAATLLAKVWQVGQGVVNVLTAFWESSPKLQKFFSGLYSGALATFKGIAEAVGKYLGGVGIFIDGMFSGDFSRMGDGLKKTLSALTDTTEIGGNAAKSFVNGWKEGLPKSGLFTKVGSQAASGTDAASAFAAGGGTGAPKPIVPILTAPASAGIVSGAGGTGRVVNITLRVDSPFRNTTINVNGVAEGAKQTADMFRDWFMAELNDVNTMTSSF